MNYKKIYQSFIIDRKNKEDILKEYHIHHIIPKSFGGKNSKDNLIRLSYSDHLFAHSLLARIYAGVMWSALFMMLNCKKKYTNKSYRNSYNSSKINHSIIMSNPKTNEHKENISKSLKGLFKSESHKEKLRISSSGVAMQEETKQKISEKLKGRVFSNEHKQKIGEANKSRKQTDESKEKIRLSKIGKKLKDETRLKMSKSSKNKRSVAIVYPDNNIKYFDSVSSVSLEFGAKKENIAMWCRTEHTPKSGKFANIKFTYAK